jgi:peptidylamidoglycolate lyase
MPKIVTRNICCFLLVVMALGSSCSNEGLHADKRYELVQGWPHLQKGYVLSQVTGVGVDSNQNIFLFHRAGRAWREPFPDSVISSNTVLMLDRHTGEVLNSWGAGYFIMPHGLTVDKDNNIWVTDVALQQVFKFTHNGKLLMKLGEEKVADNDASHFNRPTDVAVAADGSFYVSDGYRNSRVVKFSAAGQYLSEWGKKGSKPGEFNIPHAIDLDDKGNVYVADRENNRVQEFDATGKFLMQWRDASVDKLYSVTIDKTKQQLFAVDYQVALFLFVKGSNIIQFDGSGHVLHQFGRAGFYDGPKCRYHDIAMDNEGSIYVGDILNNRIQKFKLISPK